jgi:hypothetical protein
MKRYSWTADEMAERINGNWARWDNIEELQKELQDITTKALAAVWLLVQEGVNVIGELSELHDAVIGMQQDRQVADELREELRRTQVELKYHKDNPVMKYPSVNAVYGSKPNDKAELRYALPLTRIDRHPNGGLEIEVQLP